MNYTVLIVVAIIALLGGGFLLGGGNTGTAPETAPTVTEEAQSEDEADQEEVPSDFSGSLRELLALGRNVTCTVNQDDEEVSGTGTVYLSGGRVRADFDMTMKEGSGSMNGSSIQKDGMVYTWGTTPLGPFAAKVSASDKNSDNDDQGFDYDENLDFQCERWSVDESKFDLPTDVDFDDINEAVDQIDAAMEKVDDARCAACDQAPAGAREQCLAALGCS